MVTCDLSEANVEVTGNSVTCFGADKVPATTLTITGSNTANPINIQDSTLSIFFESVSITAPAPFLSVRSDVHLYAIGANSFTPAGSSTAAIGCDSSNLTFYSLESGTIAAQTASSHAAIGTPADSSCSILRFVNATVSATSTSSSAAIGCGFGTTVRTTLDQIVIDGGSITAFSTAGKGAAIGSASDDSFVNQIVVSGGAVTARAAEAGGAGIGTGSSASGTSEVGSLVITDGVFNGPAAATRSTFGAGTATTGRTRVRDITVMGGILYGASGNSGNAGIGAGYVNGAGGISEVDSIVVTGGEFNLQHGLGSAIGAGGAIGADAVSRVSSVTFVNGTLLHRNPNACAAIGLGHCQSGGNSTIGTIAVHGGSITQTDTSLSALIGGGQAREGSTHLLVGTVLVTGGSFAMPGASDGSGGIVAGRAYRSGVTRINNITILGGDFDIVSRHAAAIGAGDTPNGGNSSVGDIVIDGGTFRLRPDRAAGIGGARAHSEGTRGGETSVGHIKIKSGSFTIRAYYAAAIGGGYADAQLSRAVVDDIVIEGGDFNLTLSTDGTGIGCGLSYEETGVASVGFVHVKGGNFEMLGEPASGPGLGAGASMQGESRLDRLVIDNGTFRIEMNASTSAAIGTGRVGTNMIPAFSHLGELIIRDGSFNLTVPGEGAGIGTGPARYLGKSRVDNITIEGGSFSIVTGDGAAIGTGTATGLEGSGVSVGRVVIGNASITAESSLAGGIGIGDVTGGTAEIEEIELGDANLTVRGKIGIGRWDRGVRASTTELIVRGPHLHLECGSEMEACVDVSRVDLDVGQFVAHTNSPKMFASDEFDAQETTSLFVSSSVKGTFESITGFTVVKLNMRERLAAGQPVQMTNLDTGASASGVVQSDAVSILMTVPGKGHYGVSSFTAVKYEYSTTDGSTVFGVTDNAVIFEDVSVREPTDSPRFPYQVSRRFFLLGLFFAILER